MMNNNYKKELIYLAKKIAEKEESDDVQKIFDMIADYSLYKDEERLNELDKKMRKKYSLINQVSIINKNNQMCEMSDVEEKINMLQEDIIGIYAGILIKHHYIRKIEDFIENRVDNIVHK